MSLHTSLRLAISTLTTVRAKTPQPFDESLDLLLTQAGDYIITQDGLFLGVPPALLLYELVTQDDLTIITQSGDIIEVTA